MKSRSAILSAGLAMGIALAVGPTGCRRSESLRSDQHVVDRAKLLSAENISRMDPLYHALLRDTDVDLVVVSEPTLKGIPLSDHANRLFQNWKLGSRTRANRGILLLVAVEEKLVRLHTSYEMETLLTDAFISYVEHQMMVPYFEKNMTGPGLEATAELVARRLYEKILNKTFDPTVAGPADLGGYRAGGGGVENPVPLGGGPKMVPGTILGLSGEAASEFSAQPAAGQAWEAFLQWNERHIKDTSIGLFDDGARQLFEKSPNADASQDHIAQLYRGQAYEVREAGDLAAIVFPNDPNHLLAPWFFKRSAEGWRINGEMYPQAIVYDQLNRWGFRTDQHPYHFAFKDYDIRPGHLARRTTRQPRAYLGITWSEKEDSRGLLVVGLDRGHAAEKAGIQVGDLVTTCDGQSIRQAREMSECIRAHQPGGTLRLTLLRGTRTGPFVLHWDDGHDYTITPVTVGLHPPKELNFSVTLGQR